VTTRENADIPVGLAPIHACPGALGGVEWNGPAYSPRANLLYVPAVDWCTTFSAFEQVRYIPGKLYLGGTVSQDPSSKAQGWVTAVDAATGAVAWKYRSSRPMVAAVTTTAGDVVFTGERQSSTLVESRSSAAQRKVSTRRAAKRPWKVIRH